MLSRQQSSESLAMSATVSWKSVVAEKQKLTERLVELEQQLLNLSVVELAVVSELESGIQSAVEELREKTVQLEQKLSVMELVLQELQQKKVELEQQQEQLHEGSGSDRPTGRGSVKRGFKESSEVVESGER